MGEKQIYFDNDYSPELQRKRAQVRYIVKQLKEKNVKAKYVPGPDGRSAGAQGFKYPIRVDEQDKVERELARHRWETRDANRGGRNIMFTEKDCRFFFP